MTTPSKDTGSFWECLIYGILAAVAIWLLTRGGITLSPDSINYLSIANAIQRGLWTESLVATWPPFFPIIVAMTNSLGSYGEQSARIVSMVSYAILVMSTFLVARGSGGRLVAHLTSFSILFLAPLLFVYGFCWSETVYIALSGLAVLILARLKQDKSGGGIVWPVLAGLVVGLALLTRYLGVSLLLAGLVIVLFHDNKRGVLERIRTSVVFAGVACAPVLFYLTACSHYRERLPEYGHHTMPSLWHNIISFLGTVYRDLLTLDLSFANRTLFPYEAGWNLGLPVKILGLIAGVLLLALIAIFLLSGRSKTWIKGMDISVVYVASYTLSFVVITSYWAPISTATRFCAPIYPFVTILAFVGIVGACRSVAGGRLRALVWAGTILAVLCFWCIQAISSANLWRTKKSAETVTTVAEGDITGDGIFDVCDLLYLSNYLFGGGPQPRPLQNANVNCDQTINMADVLYLVNYIYKNGPPPCSLQNP